MALSCCIAAEAMQLSQLFGHKSSIRLLAWYQQESKLLSVDASNRIASHKISISRLQVDTTPLFQSRLESENAIVGILVGQAAGKFIISTRKSDHLFLIGNEHKLEWEDSHILGAAHKWISHPVSEHCAMSISSTEARVRRWDDWSVVGLFSLSLDHDPEWLLKQPFYVRSEIGRNGSSRSSFLIEMGQAAPGGLHCLKLPALISDKMASAPTRGARPLS